MNTEKTDGWCMPRGIDRGFFRGRALRVGLVFLLCLAVVFVCHLFETSCAAGHVQTTAY